ncbi:MAG: hypothetical protein A2070_13590 [Bdellovibrionales bacterium GWC1_52_8]|nr:MAG: hypothetical protein A2Z97_04685 [Bdellovibrionales bacterium GWB1_52_6]OFZ05551.1 MAG: hypothetical protein A2X97_11825 [Bdellovibrionales bacterium GWA1_52_35]OFZ37145.1 MAG: hypothetical protein A2070_13590 [Bdellovibrionales bacterium GWC1_52_8]
MGQVSSKNVRVEALDLARGVAVALMILSHGVKGLLDFDQIPSWGLVPIHLVTKFSSSLFIIVFGMALAAAYLPSIGTPAWTKKRNKLLLRGVVVFFWYKVLTIVEMFWLYTPQEILQTIRYQAFPVYVEILDFYAIMLLWIPFVLPLWKRLPLALQITVPVALGWTSTILYHHFDFWGSEGLRTVLVENEKHYAWGQLSRGPLVFIGMLLGAPVLRWYPKTKTRLLTASAFLAMSLALVVLFYLKTRGHLDQELLAIAKNTGKHPPETNFALFSIGGALLILAFSIAGGKSLARVLAPITLLGKDALQSFICHISVLFVFYRYLFDYWHSVSYQQALTLSALLIAVTSLWIKVVFWFRKHS